MDFTAQLRRLAAAHVSDIFIIAGHPLCYKLNRTVQNADEEKLTPAATRGLLETCYDLAGGRSTAALLERGDDDFTFSIPGVARFRVNAYKQRGSLAAVIRVVNFTLPDPVSLHIPDRVMAVANRTAGLVLVTGPAGSGKTSTLTCLIEAINSSREEHIIMLEDPIEYLHAHKRSIISQREISQDTGSYAIALRAALRQSPDVILIGELRDAEAISITLTAAETGHLVLAALHTLGAANAMDRLVDSFPAEQQSQVRMQLSMVLQTVVSQQLLPDTSGGLIPAFEVMHCNGAIRTMIRDGRTHQIYSVMQSSGAAEGMMSMDASLIQLAREGRIRPQDAVDHSLSPEYVSRQLGG